MVNRIPIRQTCNVVVVPKQRLASSNICAVLRCRRLLDTEISVLNSFLYPIVQRLNVFRSLSCLQSIRQNIRRRTVTLYFNLHSNSQILVDRSQGQSNLTSFHHCVKLRLSNAQGCQALKRGSRFHSVVTNLSHQSRETGSPAKSLLTKTVILSTCFCLRNLSAALGFPTRYRAARFNGTTSNSRGSLILWAKCFAVSATSRICLGPSMKVSYKQICILLRHFYSDSDSVFLLTPVCPVVSLVVCSLL